MGHETGTVEVSFSCKSVRWIVGGAEGTSTKDDGPGDGFTANWLNFISFSLGLTWEATFGKASSRTE